VVWVDTSTGGRDAMENDPANPKKKECSNPFEAKTVLDVLRKIMLSEEFIDKLTANVNLGDKPIGVIAMYSAQVKEIERQLARAEWIGPARSLIKIDTVDSYQGKENRIVVLSLVRNNPARRQGFLKSANRLNVAMSRAMDRLVIVGATEMWVNRNDGSPLTSVLEQINLLVTTEKAKLIQCDELKV
jgi:superfamily I DNA and/or RNA helicase